MPVVWIPALLQDLTGGVERVTVSGKSVRQVIDELDALYPGMKARLIEDDRLRPSIAVFVDGAASQQRLRHKLEENSEIHFLPAISGG
jgi:sulfur-carrier protein